MTRRVRLVEGISVVPAPRSCAATFRAGIRANFVPCLALAEGTTIISMTIRIMTQAMLVGLLFLGCTENPSSPGGADAPPPSPVAERSTLTRAECVARGGQIVGDIGDGAIYRPDYTCESGQPPIGSIRPGEGEPIAIEGEVCCPISDR